MYPISELKKLACDEQFAARVRAAMAALVELGVLTPRDEMWPLVSYGPAEYGALLRLKAVQSLRGRVPEGREHNQLWREVASLEQELAAIRCEA